MARNGKEWLESKEKKKEKGKGKELKSLKGLNLERISISRNPKSTVSI